MWTCLTHGLLRAVPFKSGGGGGGGGDGRFFEGGRGRILKYFIPLYYI